MLTQVPCQHSDKRFCAGYFTDVEYEMNKIRPSLSVQEYHDILTTFEIAFDNVEDRYGSSKQTGTDQADS